MVLNPIPKSNHVSQPILTLGVYDAIAPFNIGEKASLDILSEMNVQTGVFGSRASNKFNLSGKRMSSYQISEAQKKKEKNHSSQQKKGAR